MSKRVELQANGEYAFIEDAPGISVQAIGSVAAFEVVDDQTWKSLQKTKGKRDKVKDIIGDIESDEKSSIRRKG